MKISKDFNIRAVIKKVLGPKCFQLPGNENLVITFQNNPPSNPVVFFIKYWTT